MERIRRIIRKKREIDNYMAGGDRPQISERQAAAYIGLQWFYGLGIILAFIALAIIAGGEPVL